MGSARAMMGDVDAESRFERLARQVYAQIRDGAVDRETAFDLACHVLEEVPLDPDASELAALCAQEADEALIADAARRVLGDTFDPGFTDEPGWLAAIEQAMERVNEDMRASGLPGTARIIVPEWSGRNAFVQTWDGFTGASGGVFPSAGSDPVSALVAVADEAQGAVMESIWETWPVCPAHDLGLYAEDRDGAAVWWCKGAGGHAIALIGELGHG